MKTIHEPADNSTTLPQRPRRLRFWPHLAVGGLSGGAAWVMLEALERCHRDHGYYPPAL